MGEAKRRAANRAAAGLDYPKYEPVARVTVHPSPQQRRQGDADAVSLGYAVAASVLQRLQS